MQSFTEAAEVCRVFTKMCQEIHLQPRICKMFLLLKYWCIEIGGSPHKSTLPHVIAQVATSCSSML